ncbi:hypothetical protein E6H18_09060 [Candidatus Bathyarchaeota archaeon]|nr:MAG: hypothetical protein E6H18_09060 [Candidatus Bathyarchaeota archaeon]
MECPGEVGRFEVAPVQLAEQWLKHFKGGGSILDRKHRVSRASVIFSNNPCNLRDLVTGKEARHVTTPVHIDTRF